MSGSDFTQCMKEECQNICINSEIKNNETKWSAFTLNNETKWSAFTINNETKWSAFTINNETKWSAFTLNNIKHFKQVKFNIDKDNLLLNSLKNERSKIKNFIRRNKQMHINIRQIKGDKKIIVNKKINLHANVAWVDTKSLLDDLPNLPNIYEFTWITPIDNIDEHLVNSNINTIYIQTTIDKIKKIIKRIKILIFINEYIKYKTNNTNKVSMVYLILSNLERFFPENNQTINVKHVNGGYTDSKTNIIFVWRYEEFEKVFLHEIIHYFDMDSRHEHVETKLNINGPHSYYEAITDFWAIFYHLIYLSLITKVPIKNLLELELSFIKNQAMTLNDHFNLGNWTNIKTPVIKQTTPALSYYILKYLLFEYFLINDLIEIKDYNKLIKKITNIGLVKNPYVKLKSSRMSLLQLD